MAKILILIGGHLCTAPRPQKEADALASEGHEVQVRGFWFDPDLVANDLTLMNHDRWHFQPILDFRPSYRILNQWIRLQGRIARELFQQFKFFSPALLGHGAKAMLKTAQKAQADLTIVHSEVGLWVGNQLLNQGYQVGVDFEDWFSEDLLPEDRVNRPIQHLKVLEQRLLKECKYCLTTSQAMADAMAQAYQGPMPTVVYNCFPWAERSQMDGQIRDRQDLSMRSLHWFSQTIGPGRGLEMLFQALAYLQRPVEVHLRGNYPNRSRQWLESLIPNHWYNCNHWQPESHRVIIHPIVPNSELLSRIAEHDIGLALESAKIPSRNLTITNKLFQYLQAGLAIAATNTAGQEEVFSKYPNIGHLVSSEKPKALAQAIENLLAKPENLNLAKLTSLQVAQHHLNWEKQEPILHKTVTTICQL